MSNPASELERPGTNSSNRQAWGQDGRGGGGAGAAVVDTYEYDDSEEIRKKGCWYKFTHLIGGMWNTREMTPINVDKEIYVRTTIRELVIYCIFIVVLCLSKLFCLNE